MSDSGCDKNISIRSRDVKRSLSDLKGKLERNETNQLPIQPSILEDALDRFLLWAGNMGALQDSTNMLSLDQRLSAVPEIWEQICEFLDDLQEAVDDLTEIFEGSQPNRKLQSPDITDLNIYFDYELDAPSSLDPTYPDEANAIVEVISQCLRSLFRIGMLIRKASPRDRFQQALKSTDCVFPALFDVDHARHKYPKLCEPNAQTLAERIGNANAKRRQFIKYCRDHKSRLEFEEERSEKQSSKATTLPPIGSTQLNQLEWNTVEDEDNISLTTASTIFESTESCRLPALRELSPESNLFECPICFTLQSFRREKAWKYHAFCDLKAYICTVGGPECEEKLFVTRNAWFEHELKIHRSKYVCPICSKDSNTKAAIISHIESTHSKMTAGQISILAEAGQVVPTQFDARECPFCNEWSVKLRSRDKEKDQYSAQTDGQIAVSRSRFKRHVATHQEQLAIFVVSAPQNPGDVISGSEENSDSPLESNKEIATDNTAKESSGPIKNRLKTEADKETEEDDHPALNPEIRTPTIDTPKVASSHLRGYSGGYGGGGGGGGGSKTFWRWNCCTCCRGHNNSYIYDYSCMDCGHTRGDSCCEIYIVGTR
ncbi:hypothetical protein F4805DRAFT_250128 [Annulohypoxylon moriforme]|nr:hypothetical protein F4805DRAFT_250128 [Annulohypoxylon moriforme]